jgi:hypothetical protein
VTDDPDQAAIARVLLDEWDPLDVAALDVRPDHEYLHEAARVWPSFVRADRTGLIDNLAATARDLTAAADPERNVRCADALIAWFDANR